MNRTLVNRYGDEWAIEQRESERLTNIGGYLMTYADLSCITLSKRLAETDKARGREVMLDRLMDTPVGTSGVYLWEPDD